MKIDDPSSPKAWPVSSSPRVPWTRQPGGIKVFGEIAPGAVYRSAQPTLEGFDWLAGQGFKTVVSLRAEGKSDDLIAAHDTPLIFIRLAWEDEKAPDPVLASHWLEYAADPSRWPMLVHCKAGRGRTSVAAALCRYTLDGWTMEKAREEILLYRPDFKLFKWPLAREQKEFLALWASLHPRGEHR